MTVIILFFPCPLQEFERKGLLVPRALIDNKPEATFTIASLSYKAARLYHRYGETEKMMAAIERLPNKEDQIKFLQKHGYLEDAAQLMCNDGEELSGSASRGPRVKMPFCWLCLVVVSVVSMGCCFFLFLFLLYFSSSSHKRVPISVCSILMCPNNE